MPRTASPLPVLVLQHLSNDGPAFLATWLARHGIAADVRNAAAGEPFPTTLQGHAALAVLGGEMSANDDLPFLRAGERLILDAMDRGRPVIGHCLGGQLMAKALGAAVHTSPAPEVGWHPVDLLPAAQAAWATSASATLFQWHYEAFDLPRGATALAGNAACPHQAFAIGPHLAMQFHVEVDAAKLEGWWRDLASDEAALLGSRPTLQPVETMRLLTARHLAASQALAERLYTRWWHAASPA